jgi:hypothetical protein
LFHPVIEEPAVFAAPRRSRARRDRPFTVRIGAFSSVKSAAVPVPAALAYGIVSAFLCSAKNVPFTPVLVRFLVHFLRINRRNAWLHPPMY